MQFQDKTQGADDKRVESGRGLLLIKDDQEYKRIIIEIKRCQLFSNPQCYDPFSESTDDEWKKERKNLSDL